MRTRPAVTLTRPSSDRPWILYKDGGEDQPGDPGGQPTQCVADSSGPVGREDQTPPDPPPLHKVEFQGHIRPCPHIYNNMNMLVRKIENKVPSLDSRAQTSATTYLLLSILVFLGTKKYLGLVIIIRRSKNKK